VVYLLLAGCLFSELGYAQVWDRLVAGLGLPAPRSTGAGMTLARRRLGPGPLRELFFLLRGPAPGDALAGAAGLRRGRHGRASRKRLPARRAGLK
jgi:hypothetical protein